MALKLRLAKKRKGPPTIPGGGGGGGPWSDGQHWSSGQTGLFSRFTYVGSVRAPFIAGGSQNPRFAFIRSCFTYDPGSDTFILGAHETQAPRMCARISIPTPVPHNGTNATGLPRGTMLSEGAQSGFVDITDGHWTGYINTTTGTIITGLRVMGSKIYWVQEPVYDGGNVSNNKVIGFVDNTSNLLSLNGVAPSTVNIHYKNVARHVCVIPETWANTHVGGRRFLMGCMGISINNNASHGPNAVAVDVPTAGSQTLTTQTLMKFPYPDNTFTWPTALNAWHGAHYSNGMELIEDGSDLWLVMLANYYLGQYAYKDSTNPCGNSGGPQGFPNRLVLMVFHMDDLLSASNPWDILPREIIDCQEEFTIRTSNCIWRIPNNGGLAWDAARKRLWVMESRGDTITSGEAQPVFHALDLDAGG